MKRAELTQAIIDTINDELNKMHTALPGKILKYNPDMCTADIEPIAKFTLPSGDKMNYPTLMDVPVVFPQSADGGMGIYIPVKKGDRCLIICCELGLDGLVFEQLTAASASSDSPELRFGLTNAIAIPSLYAPRRRKNTNPNARRASDGDAIFIVNGRTELMIGRHGVFINGNEVRTN
jgi:hypothetical protein